MNSTLTSLLLLVLLAANYGADARCECMNRIVMLMKEKDYRVLSSPDYPRYYCPNLDCTWRLVAPDNTSVIHFFTDNMDLREGEDFIYFYDGQFKMDLNGLNATHSCSEGHVCQFRSSSQYVTVRFVSAEGFPQNYGFQGTAALHDRGARPSWAASLSNTIIIAATSLIILVVVLVAYFSCSRSAKSKSMSDLSKGEMAAEEKLLH